MNVKPLNYQKLSAKQLQLNNLLLTRDSFLNSRIANNDCTLQLLPVNSLNSSQYDLKLTLEIDNCETELYLPSKLLNLIPFEDVHLSSFISTLPDEIKSAVISLLVNNWIADLQSKTQKKTTLKNTQYISEFEIPSETLLQLKITANNEVYQGLLVVTDAISTWLHEISPNTLEANHTLSCLIQFTVGHTIIDTNTTKRLRKNDIIIIDNCYQSELKHVYIYLSPKICFTGEVDNNRIILKDLVENNMNDELDPLNPHSLRQQSSTNDSDRSINEPHEAKQTANIPSDDINNIPVRFTFDIGQAEISLGDVKNLQPGYSFQLGRNIGNAVLIRANGKPFAEAELVEIDQKLGARIVKLI